jgi:large subunit ribosomal protein L3
VKVTNLMIVKVVPEKNLLVVKGAVPGHKNGYLMIERWS